MNKSSNDISEQQEKDDRKVQQEAIQNQHRAEQKEVAGRHKNDAQKDHKGADKGPRGQ